MRADSTFKGRSSAAYYVPGTRFVQFQTEKPVSLSGNLNPLSGKLNLLSGEFTSLYGELNPLSNQLTALSNQLSPLAQPQDEVTP
jgi:hypothetical protein